MFSLRIVGFLFASIGVANAAPIVLTGTDFRFTFDSVQLGRHGLPQVNGNSVFFTPTTYVAQSVPGRGGTSTSSAISFDAVALNGAMLRSIIVQERGDYQAIGTGGTLAMTGRLAVSGAANTLISFARIPTLLNSTNGLVNWSATGSGAMVPTTGSYNFSLASTLFAQSGPSAGTQAFIESKFVGIAFNPTGPGGITPNAVHEPAAPMLLTFALIGWLARRRQVE